MKQRLVLALSLFTLGACTPASTEETTPSGSGGRPSTGSGGSNAGTGGSGTGGSTPSATGGSTPSATGGSTPSGTGGAAPGTGGSSPGTGGSQGSPDMGMMETSGPPPSGSPAAALENFVFDVPCPAGTVRPAGNCNVGDAMARMKTKEIQFGGDPTKMYMVKLNFCGVAEQRSYTGCMTSPEARFICIDGMPNAGTATYPTYSMAVAEPKHTYFLNSGTLRDDLAKMEYSATFPIKGGSAITFNTNGGSNADVYTAKFKGHNFMCPGAPMIMQPFEGQFWFVKVESVTPM